MMNKSVLTIVRLAFFSLMLVALVVLMILNIVENGIRTGTDKILLAMFIVLILWAGARIFGLINSLRNSR
jgi:phosphotransferase system  glucose/maltose/N-acetylglucosamine-specific IIC component